MDRYQKYSILFEVFFTLYLHIFSKNLLRKSHLYEDKAHHGRGLHICAFKKEYWSFQTVIYVKSAKKRHFYYREAKSSLLGIAKISKNKRDFSVIFLQCFSKVGTAKTRVWKRYWWVYS